MIKQWNDFIQKYSLQNRVVFLADYDMHLTQKLVQGADLWINTPRRPWEASGTSGMKVLVNGGLNLSELDGWWAEAYRPETGWAIGDTAELGEQDARNANQLYDILENEVRTAFYERDASGIPAAWIKKMRASMGQLTGRFSAHRAVSQYVEQYYKPAAVAYQHRSSDNGSLAIEIAEWKHKVERAWNQVHVVSRETVLSNDGSEPKFEIIAQVCLGGLAPSDVSVELFSDNRDTTPFRQAFDLQGPGKNSQTDYLYSGKVAADRPDTHYTLRIVPHHQDVKVPLEIACIAWEK